MTDTEPEAPASKMEDKKFYVAQDGLRGRSGGPYLDQVERELAETQRAKAEGREPDYENASAVAGTLLVTAGQLTDNIQSNPSVISTEPAGTVSEDLAFQELSVDVAGTVVEEEAPAEEAPATEVYPEEPTA